MDRATLVLLGLVCLCGCETPGQNSLAAFGPNTVPQPVRQAGTDPYYTAATGTPSAVPTASPSAGSNPAIAATTSPQPETTAGPAALAPTTVASTNGSLQSPAATPLVHSNEPPIRIVEREGVVPTTSNPATETSRLPATNSPATLTPGGTIPSTSPSTPSPLLRSSTIPKLQPVPAHQAVSGQTVAPASYVQQVAVEPGPANGEWRRR